MTSPRPLLPDDEPGEPGRSIFQYDLFSLPILRWYREKFEGLVLANSNTRRDAKALLFGEIACAADSHVPLPAALRGVSRSYQSAWRRVGLEKPSGLSWIRRLQQNVGFARFLPILIPNILIIATNSWDLFIHTNIAILVYMLVFSVITERADKAAGHLAARLVHRLNRGSSLSEAMELAGDYTATECAMVRQGEVTGSLAEALKALAEHQRVALQFSSMGWRAAYPAFLCIAVAAIATYSTVTIIPKFEDIFRQLGEELPYFTQILTNFSGLAIRGKLFYAGFYGILGQVVLILLPIRAIMSGGLASRIVSALLMFALGMMVVSPVFMVTMLFFPTNRIYNLTEFIRDWGAVFLGLLFFPWVVSIGEQIIRLMERAGHLIISVTPVINGAVRSQGESYWLGALALGLKAGLLPHEALQGAASVDGSSRAMRTIRAAEDAEKGTPIGEACNRHQVLSKALGLRLQFLDGDSQPVAGIEALAEDSAIVVAENIQRTSQIVHTATVIGAGIVVGFFVIAMYAPLLAIPTILLKRQ